MVVIKAENISKQYRLGQVGTGSLNHDINRLWYKLRGKEDPYLKIGEDNDRTSQSRSEYVWALRDINFEIKQGEVLGIVGRNGAGKSTLLKILSRTTLQTTGTISIKGRVASLLEVGTGFHPELSGRENIFLNGAILGMTGNEIKRKFDEIVDFAGIARYIDTPVKRYSSGMYVRLAFAVAAHLEPEILIVDEVLAVGDIEFQRKCIGKMKDVSDKDGRTVLFVSHNMAAVSRLCTSGIFMEKGRISASGKIQDIIDSYFSQGDRNEVNENGNLFYEKDMTKDIQILNIELSSPGRDIQSDTFYHNLPLHVRLDIVNNLLIQGLTIGVAILDGKQEKIFTTHFELGPMNDKHASIHCEIPADLFNQAYYSIDAAIFFKGGEVFDYVESVCKFFIQDVGSSIFYQAGDNIGPVRVNCKWNFV